MDKSIIYDLMENRLLRKWQEEVEQAESEAYFFTKERETLQELEAALDEKSKKLLSSYVLAIENRTDYIHYLLKVKILNFGIKIGMDLQNAFTEFKDA